MVMPEFYLDIWNTTYENGTQPFPVPLSHSRYWELVEIEGLDSSFMGLESESTVALTGPQEISPSFDGREITFTLIPKSGEEEAAWAFAGQWFVNESPARLYQADNRLVYMQGKVGGFTCNRFSNRVEMSVTFTPIDRFWHLNELQSTYPVRIPAYDGIGYPDTSADKIPFDTTVEAMPYINVKLTPPLSAGVKGDDIYQSELLILCRYSTIGDFDYSIDSPVPITETFALKFSNLAVLKLRRDQPFIVNLDCYKRTAEIIYVPDGEQDQIAVDITKYMDMQEIRTLMFKDQSLLTTEWQSWPRWNMTVPRTVAEFAFIGQFYRLNVAGQPLGGLYYTIPGSGSSYDGYIRTRPLWATYPVGDVSKSAMVIDENILPENIKEGVHILGVIGMHEGKFPDYPGPYEITPSTAPQTLLTEGKSMTENMEVKAISPINPEEGIGWSSSTEEPAVMTDEITDLEGGPVIAGTVEKEGWYMPGQHGQWRKAVIADSEKAKLVSENIKNGITVLGVEGSYEGEPYTGSYTVTPTTSDQTLPTAGKALEQDIEVSAISPVNPANGITILNTGSDIMATPPDASITRYNQKLTLRPFVESTGIGWYTRDYSNLSPEMRVGIDPDEAAKIIPGNIRQGVTILGVEGTFEGAGGQGTLLDVAFPQPEANVYLENIRATFDDTTLVEFSESRWASASAFFGLGTGSISGRDLGLKAATAEVDFLTTDISAGAFSKTPTKFSLAVGCLFSSEWQDAECNLDGDGYAYVVFTTASGSVTRRYKMTSHILLTPSASNASLQIELTDSDAQEDIGVIQTFSIVAFTMMQEE